MFYKCLPLDTPNLQYPYCPSMGASILFSILFGLTLIGHIWQAAHYRASYTWVLIMSAIWQTLAFIIRCIGIMNPTKEGVNNATYVLVLLAPLWINAFCFMVMARLVHMFMPDNRIFRVKGSIMAVLFVFLDILAFVVQLLGALKATNKDDRKIVQKGRDTYTIGVILQQVFIFFFILLTIGFLRNLRARTTKPETQGARNLTLLLLGVLSLITLRVVYRIVEFSGKSGNAVSKELTKHEVWQYCLDTLPMFMATVAFHVYHPGKVLQGPDSSFPSRREKKRQKAAERFQVSQKQAASESEYTSYTHA
ncbi:RTA1 like protein-domain-containing protein [Phaeosphaeriaceae sp. PMI808]|nr:RTA1 like protein-domain-containing protein [Phaeosphaeriaceae sp. PMI808]